MKAKGFAGSWNDTGIYISLYSFIHIDIYSAVDGVRLLISISIQNKSCFEIKPYQTISLALVETY